MSWLTEPLAFGFFRHGLIVATLAGALCGLIGVYVTLRGMSYIGHGLSHAIFGGATASALISLNFYIGAGVWGMASALAIGRVTRRRIIGSDAAIGGHHHRLICLRHRPARLLRPGPEEHRRRPVRVHPRRVVGRRVGSWA